MAYSKTFEQEIEELREEVAERDETITELKSDLRERENEINELEDRINAYKEEIKELEEKIAELEMRREDESVVLSLDTFYWGLEKGNLAVQQRVEAFIEDLKRMF